ncbi:Nucleolar protein 9, partial [Dipsacomyces acuminosporus]
ASESGYVAPPIAAGDSLFYFDKSGDVEEMEEEMEMISPASYGQVNPDLQQYLASCEDMLDDPTFDTPEDKEIFINNVFAEAKGLELQLATDHQCSRILEKLLQISSDYHIKKFFSIASKDTIHLAVHWFASHVIQTVLQLSASALERELHGETSEHPDLADSESDGQKPHTPLPTFEQLILDMAEALTSQWAYLMSNEYAPHIIRLLLYVLSGDPIEDPKNPKGSIRSRKSAKFTEEANTSSFQNKALSRKREVPESFGPALENLLRTTGESMTDVVTRGFVSHPTGSLVLQQMIELQAEHTDIEYPGSILDKALMGLVSDDDSGDNARRDGFFNEMIVDAVGSHFLQVVIKVASPRLLQRIYTRYFSKDIKELAFDQVSNFVVQSLFANVKDKKQLQSMIEEVGPLFGDLLFKNRPGVVRALVDSCVRLQTGYTEIFNALYSGLGATTAEERKELINLLVFLIKYQDFVKADYSRLRFNIQGSLIIQAILQLPGDGLRPILDSYFAQEPSKIYTWAKDPSGSRIVEAILKSPRVPFQSKHKLQKQYLGHYADLAMDKYGSHIVDACWELANLTFKEKIINELIKQKTKLQDNTFGRFLLRNYRAEQYKRRAEEWRQRERGLERKKSMFEDILDTKLDTPAASTKATAATAAAAATARTQKISTAKPQEKDEIDSLFSGRKRSSAAADEEEEGSDSNVEDTQAFESKPRMKGEDGSAERDESLDAVLSAISETKQKPKKSKSKKPKEDGDEQGEAKKKKKSKKDKDSERKKRRIFSG